MAKRGTLLNDSPDVSFLKFEYSLPSTHRYVLKVSQLTLVTTGCGGLEVTVYAFAKCQKPVDDIGDSDIIDSVKDHPEDDATVASSGEILDAKDPANAIHEGDWEKMT